ncbi:MAG: hypothetical protein ACYTFQ_09360 [Planctomycetota bacterium]|jgi:hypothetical protein
MSDDKDVYERIARLEEQTKQLHATLVQIDSKQDDLLLEFARYRGRFAGAAMLAGAVITAFKLWGGTIAGWFL